MNKGTLDWSSLFLERGVIMAGIGSYNPLSSGLNGFEVIDDTTLHTGIYVRIIVIVDAVFTTLEGNTTVTLPKTFKAGEDLGGQWTQIQLTSGEIRAYKGAE